MNQRKRPTLDLSDFRPTAVEKPVVPVEARKMAEEAGFVSRTASVESVREDTGPSIAKPVEKYVRVSLEIPVSLREELLDAARKTGHGTVRAVLLDALKAKGFTVNPFDLIDRRKT